MNPKTLAALVATLGLGAVAAPASATTLAVSCERADLQLGSANRDWSVSVDGLVVASGRDRGLIRLPLRLDSTHRVTAWAAPSWSAEATVECGPTPAPEPPAPPVIEPPAPAPPAPPVAPPVDVITPPVITPPTICTPALRNVYRNGAGLRWVQIAIRRGCVTPRRPTCADLRRVGAGPRTYARLGYYPGCLAPRPSRRPNLPAVTG